MNKYKFSDIRFEKGPGANEITIVIPPKPKPKKEEPKVSHIRYVKRSYR